IRQLYLFVVTRYVINTAQVVGFGYPVGWMITSVMMVIYFKLKGSKKPVY
ncbi:MAG: MATE family efflux transporter, partial [Erysipelotrichaceae bacterium]|nr:MATE family efflux transporter [Erysipelotrichaceae bacterium]